MNEKDKNKDKPLTPEEVVKRLQKAVEDIPDEEVPRTVLAGQITLSAGQRQTNQILEQMHQQLRYTSHLLALLFIMQFIIAIKIFVLK